MVGDAVVNIAKEPSSAPSKKFTSTKMLLGGATVLLIVASLVVMSGTSVPSVETIGISIEYPVEKGKNTAKATPPQTIQKVEIESEQEPEPEPKEAEIKTPIRKETEKAPVSKEDLPGCAFPKQLYGGKARELPTCKMPALLAPRRKLIGDNAVQVDYPEILGRYPFNSDFFRPPQTGSSINQMSDCFISYNETEFQDYCSNGQGQIVVPDRLVFFYVQDRGSWEREPLVDHIAPFILNARMRDYHGLDEFSTEDDHKAYIQDYHVNKTVMTIHFSFEGEIKDAQDIVKSFVETVDCVLEHMRMWYSPKQMEKMLSTVRGAIMVGEFFTSPKNLDKVFELVDMYRTGKAKLDVNTGLVTTKLDNGTIVVDRFPPDPKDHNWEVDTPNAPVVVPAGTPFVLPEITTSYGTSDEFLGNVPICTYTAKWRMRSPATRSYLRQYAPKMMRNDSDIYAPYIEHVMSGFRHYGRAPLSPEKSLAIKATERHYLWSFLGDLKSDRREMSEVFKRWGTELNRTFHCCGGSEEVRSFYLKSTFVPIGRGHANLDCFRIYEAAGSGAIPVIVGSRQEVYDTFGHFITSNNYLPPFIFEDSWEKAAAEANRLVNSPNELLRKQKDVVAWFFKNFWHMQKKITALQ